MYKAKAGVADLPDIRSRLRGFLDSNGIRDPARYELLLAAHEACSNVIRHAYGPKERGKLRVAAGSTGSSIVLSVRDWGAGLDPDAMSKAATKDPAEGGMGLDLICHLTDKVQFIPEEDGLKIILEKRVS